MESNAYADQTKEKVITAKDLNKMAWRGLFVQASFNYERMQACGWLYSIIPGLKKIHKNGFDEGLNREGGGVNSSTMTAFNEADKRNPPSSCPDSQKRFIDKK